MARRSRRDGGRLGDARAAPQKSKGQALWELGNAVILVLREDTQSRRAKEARAASRRARSAGPVTIHAHVTGPSHTSVRVGNGLYTLYTHICPQGTTACAGPSRPRAPPPAGRGGAGPQCWIYPSLTPGLLPVPQASTRASKESDTVSSRRSVRLQTTSDAHTPKHIQMSNIHIVPNV